MSYTNLTNSILRRLGFEILDIVNGVYRLRSTFDGKTTFDGVGILTANSNMTEAPTVFFCELNGAGGVHADGVEIMLNDWQNLDARRLIESGVAAMPIDAHHFGKIIQNNVKTERPNGMGDRYTAHMKTGDIICYN